MSFEKNFKYAAHSGSLATYRMASNVISEKEIKALIAQYGVKNKSIRYQILINACLRYSEIFSMQPNVRASVKLSTGHSGFYILPQNWARELGASAFASAISHLRFTFFLLSRAVTHACKTLYVAFVGLLEGKQNLGDQPLAYLFHANVDNFVPKSDLDSLYVLERWLYQHFLKSDFAIGHSNKKLKGKVSEKHVYVRSFLPQLSLANFLFILGWALFEVSWCVLLSFFGNWQRLFMFHELLARKILMRGDGESIFEIYMVPFQGSQARPLWADILEAKGACVVQLSYASYMLPEKHTPLTDFLHLHASQWSTVIPFNQKVCHYLEGKISAGTNLVEAPTMFFTDTPSVPLPSTKTPIISVFDISILSPSKFAGINPINDYLFSESVDGLTFHRLFFDDVLSLAKRHGFTVAYKQKRFDHRVDKDYAQLIDYYCQSEYFIRVDPRISAYRLVDASRFTVVQPFSSVGAYTEAKSEVCFYDPLMALRENHEAALGADLCVGFKAFETWFETRLSKAERDNWC